MDAQGGHIDEVVTALVARLPTQMNRVSRQRLDALRLSERDGYHSTGRIAFARYVFLARSEVAQLSLSVRDETEAKEKKNHVRKLSVETKKEKAQPKTCLISALPSFLAAAVGVTSLGERT